MPKFVVKSLGCKLNQLEGQIIAERLSEIGFEQTKDIKKANYFILNSCTVTGSADSEVNYILNKAKRENPDIIRILAGCVVDAEIENVQNSAEIVLKNSEKLKIAEILKDKKQEFEDEFLYATIKNPTSSRVNVKIQDGCNNSCAYCIIPKARGKSRSNSVKNIISQIEKIVGKGRDEVILTGIHIGLWGQENGQNLVDLLKEIEKTEIKRYRLGSLYVNEISDELIEFLKNSKKFCPHFHLSLQSMTDKTLKNMNRFYSVQDELNTIQKLHKNFDLPFLGADIIVGFPMETNEDFIETLENVKRAKLTKVHVFPYSKRPNTIAEKMPEQIDEGIKKERARKLIKVSDKLKAEFIEKNIGRELDVIFEEKIQKDGTRKGITENYIEIFTPSEDFEPNKIQKIVLKKEHIKS